MDRHYLPVQERYAGSRDPGEPTLNFAATQDIDAQAALLRGWNQSYEQISPGAFDGQLTELALGPVHLFREVTSSALQQSGSLPPDVIAVGVPMSLSGPATFCGQACDGQQLHVFSGNDQFEFFSPSGLDIVGFIVSKADLITATDESLSDQLLSEPVAPHLRAIDRQCASALRRLFIDMCQVISTDAAFAARTDVHRAMLDDVLTALRSVVPFNPNGGACAETSIPPARLSAIVNSVHDLVIDCPEQYRNVESLCGTLGVSRRTLQHAFHETIGIKPSAYLRAVRLNGARRAIKQDANVTEAATAWGFWHFGRFAHDYRTMFGELPSETARSSRRSENRVS